MPTKKAFKTTSLNKDWSKRKSKSRKKKSSKIKFILVIAISILIPTLIWIWAWWFWFYENILQKLPDIEKIDNLNLSQTSTIYDRNWEVLYSLFKENRTYVDFEYISDNMINAIISVEDKNFWTNPWIDVMWLTRAAIHDITNPWWVVVWWSTLTQQLIKNILLTKDKTIERKLKEIVLSFKLNEFIRNKVKQSYWNIAKEDIDRKVKEKILELYLNYIFLWNNAYWIESATNTYFWKSSSELDIIESSILASIPKAPSTYNPYTNRELLLWDLIIENQTGDIVQLTWNIKTEIIWKIEKSFDNTTFSFSNWTEKFLNFLRWLISFEIEIDWENYNVKYIPWRKDFALRRMYEDWYIDQSELKENVIKWFDFKFHKSKIEIKAPHFVFYIIEQLKEQYWEDIIFKWWLKIYTTLDLNVQKIAEQSIKKNIDYIISKWWNNSALVLLDSLNWDILAYVWSANYDNEEIDWKVDIIQSLRQPWSTVKPLIYSLWMMKNNFTIDNPIYDTPFKIWWNEPSNVDWKFLWIMPLKKALAYSRNIPAIKMYFASWEENEIRKFFKGIWINSLSEEIDYWYPISLWASEMKLLELASAYSHLSALWKPAKINPISKILWPDDSIIYQKKIEYQDQIIPTWIAYMIREILSNKLNFPPWWRPTYTYNWMKVATKSWTTNVKKNWRNYPRDWLFAAYTPSKVAVFWAWNTKWEPMNLDAYWWWLNSDTWKNLFEELQNRKYIKEEFMSQAEVTKVNISKTTWKRPWVETPTEFITESIWYIDNLPSETDWTRKINIDTMCKWAISDLTPEWWIWQWYLLELNSITDRDSNDIIDRWNKKIDSKRNWNEIWTEFLDLSDSRDYFIAPPSQICEERRIVLKEWKINTSILNLKDWSKSTRHVSLWYNIKSPFLITDIQILADWRVVERLEWNSKEITKITDIFLNSVSGEYAQIEVKAIDEKWYDSSDSINIKIVKEDIEPPFLVKNKAIIKETWDSYEITLVFSDELSSVEKWQIYEWNNLIKEFTWNIVQFKASSIELLRYNVEDSYWNNTSGKINM